MKLVLATIAILVAGSLLLANAAADTASDARGKCAASQQMGARAPC